MRKQKLKIIDLIIRIFGLTLLTLGIVSDILLKTTVISNLFIVSENYILYVFSLIFTVSTLGCTILSIIVGASNDGVLGLKLREIISLSDSPLKLETMIAKSFSLVTVSIPLLAFECNTAITILAIYLIVFIVRNTLVLCKIVFDKEYTKSILLSNLKKTTSIKSDYVQYWITALYTAINEDDIAYEEELLLLLENAAENQPQICNQIGKQVQRLFFESYQRQSFIDTYKRILRLNKPSKIFFDERNITFNYIKNLKYQTPEIIDKINLGALLEDIVMCEFLEETEKINNCCWFFSAVIENNNICESDRLNIIYNGFCSLLWLDDDYGFGHVRVKIVINIFRNKVLLVENFEYGKKIYTKLIKAIYTRNQLQTSKHLASLLSQIVRMIYFWSYMEIETLSESRRNLILTIPDCIVETTDNAALSISFLIEEHHKKMVEFLVADAFNSNWADPLDYYPDLLDAKLLVCTPENKIKFAFWFYAIWGYDYNVFPIKQEKTNSKDKLSQYKHICIAVLREFEINKELSHSAIENIQKLQQLFHNVYQLPQQFLAASFKNINDEITNINTVLNDAEKCTIPTICDALKKKMIDASEIPLDESICLDDSDMFQIAPILCYKKTDYNINIVSQLQLFMTNTINQIIKNRMRVVTLSFDKNGVKKLRNELKKCNYTYRNYTFYDDWAIQGDVRETEEFKELVSLVDSVTYKRNTYIRNYLFLNVDDIKMNYSIDEVSYVELEGDVLEKYLDQYRVADEQYCIDGGIYNKVSAVTYFHKSRILLIAKLKVETNVKSNSGFRVDFKRFKKNNNG